MITDSTRYRKSAFVAAGFFLFSLSSAGYAAVVTQSYGVNVHAAGINTNIGNSIAANYNRTWNGYGNGTSNNLSGPNTQTTTCDSAWPCNPSFNVTSNQTAAGNATTAGAEATFSVNTTRYGPDPSVYVGKGMATANLATGSVGVYAQGQRTPTNQAVLEQQIGVAGARIADTLNFTVSGANAQTITPISVRYMIDGRINPTQISPNTLGFWFGFGNALAFGSVSQSSSDSTAFVNGSQNSAWASYIYTILSEELIQFDGVYNLLGSSQSLGVAVEMLAQAGGGAVAYDNTARFAFVDLPSNVTYTSDSGVFLSGNNGNGGTQVPEPGSLALLSLGLVGLGKMTWVRRRIRP